MRARRRGQASTLYGGEVLANRIDLGYRCTRMNQGEISLLKVFQSNRVGDRFFHER